MFGSLRKPAIVLFFLSPLIAELMTGSAPPGEFFNPLGFFFIVFWYGCGVLLIREISVRKNLSWTGIFVLGMAFGILEEGIFVKTFFDPHAVDVGEFLIFGEYFGVNIPWTVYLTMFHALCSILFPIMLVYLFFADEIHKPWIGRIGMILCGLVLTGFSLFGWKFFDPSQSGTPYIPDPIYFLGSLAIIVVLILISFKLRECESYQFETVTKKARRRLLLQGFVIGVLFSLGVWVVAALSHSTIISVLYILFIIWIIFHIKKRTIRNNIPMFCYFIIGNYFFWAFVGFLQEFGGMVGMSITGIGFMLFFFLTVRYLNRHYAVESY